MTKSLISFNQERSVSLHRGRRRRRRRRKKKEIKKRTSFFSPPFSLPTAYLQTMERKSKRVPPRGYVCRKCSIPGHWIEDCPPPANYSCGGCHKIGDHFISACPEISAGQKLWYSSLRGHVASVRDILRRNPDIDVNWRKPGIRNWSGVLTKEGSSPLEVALDKNHQDVVDILVEHPEIKEAGENLLWAAASRGDAETVAKVLSRYPRLNIEWKRNAMTALEVACDQDHQEAIRALVNDPRIQFSPEMQLYFSVRRKRALRVSELLDQFPNLDLAWEWKGQSTASVLLKGDDSEIIGMLASLPGFNINGRVDSSGDSLFGLALLFRAIKSVKLFLRNPNVNVNSDKIELLAFVSPDLVELLVASGRQLAGMEKIFPDPLSTCISVRKKMGLPGLHADLFVSVVFLSDEFCLVRIPPDNPSLEFSNASRFFRIAAQLPMELQMVLCHKVYESTGTNITSRETESAFAYVAAEFTVPRTGKDLELAKRKVETKTLQISKQLLGERLYARIQEWEPVLAGKITGMLLDLKNEELLHLLETEDALIAKIAEAIAVLHEHAGAQ